MKSKIILLAIILLAAVLRLYSLDSMPWGLNADEAAIGYNAYSLIQTGRDEHGAAWPLVFRSFDDFKPPVYLYLVLPFVKILGLNIWAVRLPSALLGIATVYLTYLLGNLMFPKKILATRYQLLSTGEIAAFLLAISPWHLQYSRGGWEVNASLFFLTLGLWAFFKGLSNQKFLYLWIVSFVLAMYTYHSMRIVVPLLGVFLLIVNWNLKIENFQKNFKHLVISIMLGVLLLLPLAFQFLGSTGGSARFAGVSIFADQGPLNYVLEMRRTSPNPNSITTKLLYNRYSAYAGDFLKNIILHLSPDFLFISGDALARNMVPGMGQSYLWTLPFFFIGIFSIFRKLNKEKVLIVFWFLVGITPAAITFQSPHALRSENIVAPFMIIISMGIYQTFAWLKSRSAKGVLAVTLLVVTFLSLKYYLHQYYIVYPQQLGYAWQPGFDKLADYLKTNGSKYDKVVVSTRYDQPYILLAFFLKYDPALFQKELIFSTPDKFGFSTGLQFGKYYFHKIDWAIDTLNPKTLIVVADEEVGDDANLVDSIPFPNGDSVYRLYATK